MKTHLFSSFYSLIFISAILSILLFFKIMVSDFIINKDLIVEANNLNNKLSFFKDFNNFYFSYNFTNYYNLSLINGVIIIKNSNFSINLSNNFCDLNSNFININHIFFNKTIEECVVYE